MGFFSNVASRVRSFWTKDKERAALQLAKGAAVSGLPASGYDLLQAYGYNVVADYLRLEQDLLARFIDYEEMDDYPLVAAALDIFADDSTQPDTQLNRTVWVTSPDRSTKTTLDDLLHKRLRLDEEIWEISRTTCKYGQDYEEILVTPQGVVGLNFLPPPTVRRIEGPRGELFGFVQDFQGRFGYTPEEFKHILATRSAAMTGAPGPLDDPSHGLSAVAALEDWEVVHFRLRGKHRRNVYGYSIMESGRWIWKRLLLLEDSALIYRLQRAPERFAFYVDVGDLPPAEALAYVNRVRQQYKKRKFVNPTTGRIDLRFDPLAQDEDFFLPTRQGQEGTKIDVLGAPQWQHMEDIQYFQGMLFSALKVPKAYLAHEETTARAVLSTEDVRFARSVLRVQRELVNGIRKICRVHLAALGIDPYSQEYEVKMTVPSSIFELAQLEVRNARADFAGRMKEFVSLYWVYKNILGLSDEDIDSLVRQREQDVKDQATWQAKAEMEAQKIAAQAQAAAGGGEAPGMPAVTGSLRDAKSNGRSNGASRHFALPAPGRLNGGARGISERELFAGHRADMEKRAEDKLESLLKHDAQLRRSIQDLREMVSDLTTVSRRG